MKKLLIVLFALAAQNAFADATECYKEALTKLSVSTAVKICKQATDLAPIECYKNAVDKVGPSVAVSICAETKSVAGPLDCYTQLQTSLGASIASKLCKASENAADSKACYEKALNLGLGGQAPGYSMGYTNAAEICTP